MIAFCGLDCEDCPAYRATRSRDPAALETVLVYWRETLDLPDLALADVVCDGCQADGQLNSSCRHCTVRSCAQVQGVPSCAYCADYPCADLQRLLANCDRQHGFFAYARAARGTLAQIHADLR